jgi:PiT family inorganic phosphate transporter
MSQVKSIRTMVWAGSRELGLPKGVDAATTTRVEDGERGSVEPDSPGSTIGSVAREEESVERPDEMSPAPDVGSEGPADINEQNFFDPAVAKRTVTMWVLPPHWRLSPCNQCLRF